MPFRKLLGQVFLLNRLEIIRQFFEFIIIVFSIWLYSFSERSSVKLGLPCFSNDVICVSNELIDVPDLSITG